MSATLFDAGVLRHRDRHRELSKRFEASPSIAQERVLVVDDSSDGRRMIAEILGCLGLSASVAENGRAAIAIAMAAEKAGHPYDLILMDSQMPEVDGYEATASLRAMGYTGKIVALMSESIFGARYDLCAQAGCDGYASKPITFPMLRGIIRTHLPMALQGCSRKLA